MNADLLTEYGGQITSDLQPVFVVEATGNSRRNELIEIRQFRFATIDRAQVPHIAERFVGESWLSLPLHSLPSRILNVFQSASISILLNCLNRFFDRLPTVFEFSTGPVRVLNEIVLIAYAIPYPGERYGNRCPVVQNTPEDDSRSKN